MNVVTGTSNGNSTHEFLVDYETELAELTFNSKPLINTLTIIAGENTTAASEIVRVIAARIKMVCNSKSRKNIIQTCFMPFHHEQP
jgi:hypothetical protein